MKKRLMYLSLLAVAAADALAAPKLPPKSEAAGKSATQRKEGAKPGPRVYQPFSFDALKSGHIDPKYIGVPLPPLFAAIEKMTQLTKGEFESTTEFEKRRAAALETKLLGNLTLDDILPVVVSVEKQRYDVPLYYAYDADKAQVSLTDGALPKTYNGIGGPGTFSPSEQPSYYTFAVDREFAPKETYTGTNGYGASVTVEKLSGTDYVIATDRSTSLTLPPFAMEATRAASELPSLKALLLVKLRAPYVAYDFFHSEPTRTHPTELTLRTKAVFGDVLGVVYFSGKTGEIIAKTPGMVPATDVVSQAQ